jgi:ribonuclease P protein component
MNKAFPRNHRVNKASDFKPVLRFGKPLFSEHGKLICKKNNQNCPRFGIIVSKKAARQAVSRNRIKRVARDLFRHERVNLPNMDLVFIARTGSEQVTNEELRVCIKKMLNQLPRSVSSSL